MKRLSNIGIKILVIIIILALIFFAMSNSYSTQNIDKLAYVVALGIDIGSNDNIKLSIQIAKPSSVSSSSSSQSSSSVVNSVECSSIETGINLFNSYISRSVNLSHCKIIVISEELAANGVQDYLYDLTNNVEVSSHANIIITKCSANTYLKMANPTLENFPARYYEIVNTSSKITGYTKANSLIDFFSVSLDSFQEPVAVLANINNDETHFSNISKNVENKDSSYVAGETPINSSNNIENMGLAVFRNGKMIGELNGLESICHLIVSGNLKYCNIQIKNPEDDNSNVSLKLKLAKDPVCKVFYINGYPYINLNININAQISSANSSANFSDNSSIDELESKLNSYLESSIYDYLYKVSKQYKSDIDGFGKYTVKNFLTKDEWDNYNWLENFPDSFFKVTIKSKIKSSANFINS